MSIHLLCMVGYEVKTLPFLLKHYASEGIDSFLIYVHESESSDVLLRQVQLATSPYKGAQVMPIHGDWLRAKATVLSVMNQYPDDWFVTVDQDEFHLYPCPLKQLLEDADRKHYDCITGFFVDRVASDGSLPPLDLDRPIWDQYPLGGFLTHPICRSDFRKVVLAKGRVTFTDMGHHEAVNATPYPLEEVLIEVHHFKWVGGLIEYLEGRHSTDPVYAEAVRSDAMRFCNYFKANGNRIATEDPGLLIGACKPNYPYRESIRHLLLTWNLYRKLAQSLA